MQILTKMKFNRVHKYVILFFWLRKQCKLASHHRNVIVHDIYAILKKNFYYIPGIGQRSFTNVTSSLRWQHTPIGYQWNVIRVPLINNKVEHWKLAQGKIKIWKGLCTYPCCALLVLMASTNESKKPVSKTDKILKKHFWNIARTVDWRKALNHNMSHLKIGIYNDNMH